MITVNSDGNALSPDFISAISEPMVSFDVQLVDDGTALDCAIRTLSLTLGTGGDAMDASCGIPIGSACTAQLSARLAEFSGRLLGHELEVRVGVELADGSHEYVTVAWATVTYAWSVAGEVSIQGFGRIASRLTGEPLGLAAGAHSPQAVASAIARASGVAVTLGGFESTAVNVGITGSESCRAALSALALALGGIAAETHDGGILVAPFATAATCAVGEDIMPQLPKLAEEAYTVDGLTVTVPADPESWDGEGGEPQALTYSFGTGRILVEDANATQATAEALWANIQGVSYRPGEVTLAVLDPRITPFDAASVPLDGQAHLVPSFSIQASYDGGWYGTFSAAGTSEAAEESYQAGPVEAAVGEARAASKAALAASARAQESADAAQESADAAAAAAQAAIGDAATAQAAAEAAQGSADDASRAAAAADEKAANAGAAAVRANTAATDALEQLSTVQDVVGTVEWAAAHSGEDMASYITSHLALTDAGLWVTLDATGYRLLVAATGVSVVDPAGHVVSTFGESVSFDSSRPQWIGGEDAFIAWYDSDGDGKPDSLWIGGSSVRFGSLKLSDVLASVTDSAALAQEAIDTARDVAVLTITSTNGLLFKNGSESTVLQAAVFPSGGGRLDTMEQVRERFGAGAYIEWSWRHEGGAWGTLVSTDAHISNDGMWLTVAPADVAAKTSFSASLIVP